MKFLLSGHLPDDYAPSAEDEGIGPAIHALNAEMEAAGALFFAAGLLPASLSKTVRATGLVTDGPYTETKEHLAGFLILDCADLEEALEWARKGAAITRRPVEVRQIFFNEG